MSKAKKAIRVFRRERWKREVKVRRLSALEEEDLGFYPEPHGKPGQWFEWGLVGLRVDQPLPFLRIKD